ncbi:MAG: glycosyltransferase [Spirochaetales bacterium]
MKIGQFGESFIPVFDGVGRVMKAYAETMTKRGNEVYVITPMYDTGYRGGMPFEIVDYNSIGISEKIPWRVGIKEFDQHFIARMKQIDLDIIHVHGPVFAGNIGLQLAKKRHLPIVGTFHTKFYDDILNTTGSKTIAKVGAEMVARFYAQCDEVWAVSEGTGETLRDYGYKGKVVVMPNGTNIRTLNVECVPEVREKYGIRTDIPVLLFVGQLSWKKNLRRTIEACGILKKEGTAFQLVLAGRGPDEEEIKKLIEEQGLSENTVFTGHLTNVETLDALYSIASLFVFPSTYDNAPMVVREAAAMNTAALVAEGSCSAEVIKHLESGIIAKDDSEDVAKGIKIFLELPEEKKRSIEQKAYETIPVPWDGKLMDTILGRYQNLIDSTKLKYRKKPLI